MKTPSPIQKFFDAIESTTMPHFKGNESALVAFRVILKQRETMLELERQFAEVIWNESASQLAGKKLISFTEFYKQFEDESEGN